MNVFCIGAHKTGTHSVRTAMEYLGYDIYPIDDGYKYYLHGPGNNVTKLIKDIKNNKNTFYKDTPFNHFDNYKVINQEIPDSLFILTVRNKHDWLKSVNNWLLTRGTLVYDDLYNLSVNRKNNRIDNVLDIYERRNLEIIEYFKKTNKLLVLDMNDLKWEKLCTFLKKEIPSTPFPHCNKQVYNTSNEAIDLK